MTPPQQPPPRTFGERSAILLGNLSKFVGLAIGGHEAFGQARPSVLLFATAIYMGAQATEDLVLKVLERALH